MQRAAGHESTGRETDATLYVVATPIGNLQDVTLRALEVLKTAHVIAAEDTRVTARLLEHYAITAKKLIALHEHNESRAAQTISAHLGAGSSVALVSDAGTPAFSDPGARLVGAVREAGYRVTPIPGANAAAAALSASGFTERHFLVYGCLPAKPGVEPSLEQFESDVRTTIGGALSEVVAALGGAITFSECHYVASAVAENDMLRASLGRISRRHSRTGAPPAWSPGRRSRWRRPRASCDARHAGDGSRRWPRPWDFRRCSGSFRLLPSPRRRPPPSMPTC